MTGEAYNDRRAGLVGFGWLHIVLGVVTLMMLFRATAKPPFDVANTQFVLASATFYFVAAGIGSIRGRRWARALIAAVSGIWAAVGAVMAIAVPFMRIPAATMAAVIAALLLLPLVLVFFYGRRDTGLTADALDPVPRWTDRVPVPVLALCVFLGFSAIESLMNATHENFQLFGYSLTGAPGALAMIALGILFAHLAVQVYRLRQSAWWTLILLQVIGSALSAATLHSGHAAAWVLLAAASLVNLGFLIWLRRYFAAT